MLLHWDNTLSPLPLFLTPNAPSSPPPESRGVHVSPEQQSDWSVQRRRCSSHVPPRSHEQAGGTVPGPDPAVGSQTYKGHVTICYMSKICNVLLGF